MLSVMNLLYSFAQEPPKWEWAKGMQAKKENGLLGKSISRGIVTDDLGNVYVTGTFSEKYLHIEFDTLIKGFAREDIFLIKYSTDGEYLWSKRIGRPYDRTTNPPSSIWDLSIAIDSQNYIYLTGSFTREIDFGNGVVLANKYTDSQSYKSNRNVFVAKFNENGVVQWARQFGNERDDRANCIAVDKEGGVYITGVFRSGIIQFGSETLYKNDIATSLAQYDEFFIAKYDKNGNPLWINGANSGAVFRHVRGNKLTADKDGNIVVAGEFSTDKVNFGTFEFDNNDNTGSEFGSFDIFIAQYSKDGEVIWAQSYGGDNNEHLHTFILDPFGDFLLFGTFNSPELNISDSILFNDLSPNNNEGFGVKFSPEFNVKWAKNNILSRTTIEFQFPTITVDKLGRIYSSLVGLGGNWVPITHTIVVTIYNPMFELITYATVRSSMSGYACMASDYENNLYIAGDVSGEFMVFNSDTLPRGGYVAKLVLDKNVSSNNTPVLQNSLVVFPNPADNFFHIAVDNFTSPIDLLIIDIYGRVLLSETIVKSNQKVSISNLKPGSYIVMMESGHYKASRRLIKY